MPTGPPPTPLAGRGLGERWTGEWSGSGAGSAPWGRPAEGEPDSGGWEVREAAPGWGEPAAGAPPAGAPGRLAGAVYAPLDRPAVPLSGRSGEPRPFRLLGQYKGTLILLEGPDGLYLIDQHVAHERLLYERLRRALARDTTPSQRLLTPQVLELSAAEHLRLSELAPGLEGCGFELAPLSGGSLALAAVPAALGFEEAERLLRELAADDGEGTAGAEGLARRVLEALAASLACKAAVKMHHPLAPAEMEALVAELFVAENPYACPHGRPVVLKMGDADLERRFGRR
jgi:DNA mismatch repair protein MutL